MLTDTFYSSTTGKLPHSLSCFVCAWCGMASSRLKFIQRRLDNNKSDAAAAFRRLLTTYASSSFKKKKKKAPIPPLPPLTSVSNIILHTAASRTRYSVRFFLYVMPRKPSCDATCGGSMLNRQMRLTPRDSSPSGQTQPGLWQECHSKYVREAESGKWRGFLLRLSLNLQPPPSHLLPLKQNRRASPSSWAKWGSGRLDIT